MCPLWPVHYVILYMFAMLPLILHLAESVSFSFSPEKISGLITGNSTQVVVTASGLPVGSHYYELAPVSADTSQPVVTVAPRVIHFVVDNSGAAVVNGSFNITALRLGYVSVQVRAKRNASDAGGGTTSRTNQQIDNNNNNSQPALDVKVIRDAWSRRMDTVFGVCVAVLMGLTYVNMGCTLDLDAIRQCVVRPVGPAIGLLCQYVVMPLAGFGLAALSATTSGLQLGIFVAGCSPGGGASNIWTYLLGGNVNLSVTMTLISSLLAFAAMPGWLFCLGHVLVGNTTLVIPYRKLVTLLLSLVIPCAIGIAIRRHLPKVANCLTAMLKPWSVILFAFILSFGIYCNQHLWGYLKWNLVLSAGCMPLLGFVAGALAAWMCGRSFEDAVAICVETGVQNTGVAIYLLKFSLEEPANDIAILAPIIVASMTPLPLFTAMIVSRVRRALLPSKAPVLLSQKSLNKFDIGDKPSVHQFADKVNYDALGVASENEGGVDAVEGVANGTMGGVNDDNLQSSTVRSV